MAEPDRFLDGLRVLVVEDEPFIALDLASGVEDAGGTPVGPASTVAQALALIDAGLPDAAIVDADLPDGDIGPVLAVLCPNVPVVVHTGVGLPERLKQVHPDVQVFTKPTPLAKLAARLTSEIARR
ncbi:MULTISPECIES: response regulator [unclassified Marinovum]